MARPLSVRPLFQRITKSHVRKVICKHGMHPTIHGNVSLQHSSLFSKQIEYHPHKTIPRIQFSHKTTRLHFQILIFKVYDKVINRSTFHSH